MAGLPKHRDGIPVKNPPTGFPLFFDKRKPRVVTADPWAFITHLIEKRLPKAEEDRALALVEQAFDFHEAAANPHLGSKPLLHYYSFLNLVKAALLFWQVNLPANAQHGIVDPKANTRTRLRLEGQHVKAWARTAKHDQVFAELVDVLGGDSSRTSEFKVVGLLAQVPFIHRTFTQATGQPASLVPVQRIEVLHDGEEHWVRLCLRSVAPDVRDALPELRKRQRFTRFFRGVTSAEDSESWFESEVEKGRNRGVDNALRELALQVRSVGVSSLLSVQGGYRYYLTSVSARTPLPHLAVSYAVMFYLGSVTRYQPDVFDKIIDGNYSWVVSEFLAACPRQFLYLLASEMAEVDVVRPYAAIG